MAIARAKVTLKKCASHSGRRVFVKDKPQIVSGDDVKYYQSQSEFEVIVLQEASLPEPVKTEEPTADVENVIVDEFGYDEKSLSKMKKQEVIDIADELGLDTSGTVKQLIRRITEVR